MSSTICILNNAYSGNGKGVKISALIQKLLTDKKVKYEAFENNWPQVLNKYSQVWIVGGDGTLAYYLNKYKNFNSPITIFAGGTGNDFHWKLYSKIKIEDQVAMCLKNNSTAVDYGICNGRKFINCVGIGFDGEALKSIKLIRYVGGFLGYYLSIVKTIFSFSEPSYHLKFNDILIENKFLIVNIANSSRTGGGILVSPLAEIDDGFLNIVLVDKLNVVKRLSALPLAEKGKHLDLPYVSHYLTNEISIKCDKIVHYQMDGELLEDNTFEVAIKKGKLRFLV